MKLRAKEGGPYANLEAECDQLLLFPPTAAGISTLLSDEKNEVFFIPFLQTHNMNLLGYLFKCTQNNLDS